MALPYIMTISFIELPDIADSIKNNEPYYWETLELHKAYKVISDYEKVKSNGKSEHFLLIANKDNKLVEVPMRNNIKVTFVG